MYIAKDLCSFFSDWQEFAVRNRMGMKELQQQTLKEITEQGKLTKQQADWLMSEHLKNQKALEGMYDEEISRQRQVLEEKLARRKALAMAAVSLLYLFQVIYSEMIIIG